MENIGDMLARARQNRKRRGVQPPPEKAETQALHRPQHQSSHSSYTALMRSHDRMGTRHLKG